MRRHEHVATLDHRLQPETAELATDHDQVVGFRLVDPKLSLGGRGERHEARHLDVVGADPVLGAAQLVAPVHGHHGHGHGNGGGNGGGEGGGPVATPGDE